MTDPACEFELAPGVIHLNHAGVAPWPRRTVRAIEAFARENQHTSSLHFGTWLATERHLRDQLRRLINAPSSDDIALLKNTSEGLSTVAFGLSWRQGDSVVGIAEEFPSNRAVWAALAPRFGVDYRAVSALGRRDPEAALMAACDRSTRLIAVSAVQYLNGLRLDLERIGSFCRQHGILFCVDAIQQLGALPLDVQAIGADFLAADGHKWLLAPEGVALLYCRDEARERLTLNQYGWHMLEHVGDFESPSLTPATSARRFEAGSPNNLGIHALSASLALLEEVGIADVAARIAERVALIIERVRERGGVLLTPTDPARRAGIVTFRLPGVDSARLYEELMKNGVLCALRMQGIRFSPHFYTPHDAVEAAFLKIDELRKPR